MADTRREYRPLSAEELASLDRIKRAGQELIDRIDEAEDQHGLARELHQARVRAEESVMWATKGVSG